MVLVRGGLGAAVIVGALLFAEPRPALIARSKVWRPTNIPSMNLKLGPQGPGSFAPGETITCDFVRKEMSGATPKFPCRLPDGDELKVKYGGTNGEVYGEVAASRLLWALGFGADRMYSVRVICHGCPETIGFEAARVDLRAREPGRGRSGFPAVDEWVRAFNQKREQIVQRRCPS